MYLDIAKKYLLDKKIQGIRISTRPDYIDAQKLDLLNRYGVSTIELGAQSLDDKVLELCGRGHKAADVEKSIQSHSPGRDTFGAANDDWLAWRYI